jgi:hypothetical protein
MTKGQPTLHPNTSCDLFLINIRHHIGLSGGCGCGWHLKLLLENGDRRCPLLKLKALHLDGMFEVHNHVGVGVHLLMGEV